MRGITYFIRCVALAALLSPFIALAAQPERVEQGNLIFDGIPARDPQTGAGLADYLESRQASFVGWLADGSLLIRTRFGDAEQLHRVRTPLGQREQLTFYREPVGVAAASPVDADSLVFLQARGDSEHAQLYLRGLADNATRLLSDGKSLQGPPAWSNDGKRVAFFSAARDGVNPDIYVADTTTQAAPRLVAGGDGPAFTVQDWSYDDQKLLLLKSASNTGSSLYIADLASGKLTQLELDAKSRARMHVSAARFSRDGRGVYFVSTQEDEFAELRYMDMYSLAMQSLTPESRWDVEQLQLSRDGHYLAYTLNEAGLSRLVVHDIQSKADLLLPPLPAGSIITNLGFDRSDRQLAVSVESAQSPSDVFVYDLTARPVLTRWTQSELGPINTGNLVPAERFSYATWDRDGTDMRQIPAFLYRPKTAGPHPVLIDLHGGPASQFRPGWNAFTQYLVNELGYTVVAPNPRGSRGYGRSFLELADGRLHEDSLRDIGSLLVWIGLQRDLDRSRVVVMGGGSRGGDRTLASLAQYNDRLAGGIDVLGSSIAPLTNGAAIRKPLLIVQGLNDPRVPASASEQLLWRVRSNGGEAWYLAAKDEGQGFRKKGEQDAYLETVASFLQHLARRQ